jgi:hypothetical protein
MKPEERFGFEENMPEPIRVLFVELAEDVVQLHHTWEFMSEIFGKPVNVSLLNKTAPAAGRLIGQALEDSMIMAACRLSDKLWTRQDNLTLERLAKACSEIPGLEQLCKDFYTTTSPFRAHRNKRISHDDLGTAIKPHENPLPGLGYFRQRYENSHRNQPKSLSGCIFQGDRSSQIHEVGRASDLGG